MRTHDHRDMKVLRPDSKGRVHLGALTNGISGYKLTVDKKTHVITLDPYVEIPLTEKWLFDNPKALESIKRGLQDSTKSNMLCTEERGKILKQVQTIYIATENKNNPQPDIKKAMLNYFLVLNTLCKMIKSNDIACYTLGFFE